MADFWIDENVFIEAKNRAYAFDIAPGFWDWLKQAACSGTVRSPAFAYEQMRAYGDELSVWLEENGGDGLFAQPGRDVQVAFRSIADYVTSHYSPEHARLFLSGSDPWVIAHARAAGGTVATHEIAGAPQCRKAKIPNVCAAFNVECCTPYDMFRALGLRLRL